MNETLVKNEVEQVIAFFTFDIVPIVNEIKLKEAKKNVVDAIMKIIKEEK